MICTVSIYNIKVSGEIPRVFLWENESVQDAKYIYILLDI